MRFAVALRRQAITVLLAGVALASSSIAVETSVNAAVSSETSPSVLLGPTGSVDFGRTVRVLANGNYAVLDTSWSSGTVERAGALHLYDGRTDALISTLTGTTTDDLQFARVAEVGASNLVLTSPGWDRGGFADAGAITWIDGSVGLSGVVDESNSAVGSTVGDRVGGNGVTVLTDADFVVSSTQWAGVGAVTWFDGNGPTIGSISATNSIVGSQSGDEIGDRVIPLTNGHFVTTSEYWANGSVGSAGAATWGSGEGATVGAVSEANSLIGSTENDSVGTQLLALADGDYVIGSAMWNNGVASAAGAVTWGDGLGGTIGAVGPGNSLVGGATDDRIGSQLLALSNGHYAVASPRWSNGGIDRAGAATFGRGDGSTIGAVSPSNSLVGASEGDEVGTSLVALQNGNYVVASPTWKNNIFANAGAVTWGNGTAGTVGVVSAVNSLVGGRNDIRIGSGGVTALTNGNYVVASPQWAGIPITGRGAVTWGDGVSGTVGTVSDANSLVGTSMDDFVGLGGVVALTNGNYVVSSSRWDGPTASDVGAVTWGDGSAPLVGPVGPANSLIGTTMSDRVGSGSVVPLTNGNYVVVSSLWNSPTAATVGAATWGEGSSGTIGTVSVANSLVGTRAADRVGWTGVRALSDGNYVVVSGRWDSSTAVDVGAATWRDGTMPSGAEVTASNSLVGSSASDLIGSTSKRRMRFVELEIPGDPGGYVVASPTWATPDDSNAGAATFGAPGIGATGVVNASNSAVGAGGVRTPGGRLTSGDAVVVPTSANRVLLLRLDRPPVFPVVPDVAAATAAGDNTAVVPFAPPIASDVRDGPIESTCSPSSGSEFVLGDTTVTCTATDSKGQPATVAFTVTVTVTESDTAPDPDPPVPSIAEVVSLAPSRVFASRAGDATTDGEFQGGGRIAAGAFVKVRIAGRVAIDADAKSAVMNVTAINPLGRGFVTVYPCGDRPLASSLNFGAAGAVVGNELVAKLSSSGEVCVYTSVATDLSIDVVGFVPASSSVMSLDPARVFATRVADETVDGRQQAVGGVAAGSFVEVEIVGRAGVPLTGVGAVVMNVTAINPSGRGFLTVYPCGDRPLASSLNFGAGGAVVGNELVAKLSATGTVCVYSSVATDLAVDVVGFVPASSLVMSLDPARVFATRVADETVDGRQQAVGGVAAGSFVEVEIVGRAGVPLTGVGAVVMNVTAINPSGRGFLTVYPCGDRPLASSLNFGAAGAVVGNELVAKLSATGTVCVYSSVATDLAVDVVGYIPN